jgi:predicted RNA-binding Zn-ribbon protein involved in translation (DUF1610 family)
MKSLKASGISLNLGALRPWIIAIAFIWLLGSLGLGWIVKSLVFLLVLVLLAPVVLFFGARWWLSRNLIQAPCPVCGFELTGLSTMKLQCPSCNEPLVVRDRQFHRITSPGTIDVEAVDLEVEAEVADAQVIESDG